MRRIWSVLLPLALAACDGDATLPSRELVLETSQAQTTVEAAAVAGAQGGLVIQGVYAAPTTGFALRAYYHVKPGNYVSVFLEGVPPQASHPAVVGHEYRITLPLRAGTHTVNVSHYERRADGGLGQTRQIAREEVTVGGL